MVDGVDGLILRYGTDERRPARRRWPDRVKAQIVAESFQPGVRVVDVARRYGLIAQQIFDWRRHARQGRLCVPAGGFANFSRAGGPEPMFAPLAVIGEPEATPFPAAPIEAGPAVAGMMSVELGADVVVRIPGDVPLGRATALVQALRGVS
jgi:transposase